MAETQRKLTPDVACLCIGLMILIPPCKISGSHGDEYKSLFSGMLRRAVW
jgi:hypothetical protein